MSAFIYETIGAGFGAGFGSVFTKTKLWKKSVAKNNKNLNRLTWVSDVTKIDSRPVDKIFYVKDYDDIIDVIRLAKANNKKISIRGQSHTMGGQTIIENGYLIDMKYLNRIIDFDESSKTVTVEPGIMWCELIKFLNEYGLSPTTLQSYSSFSIGGSLSVNAHGITNDYGVAESVISLKFINSDGKFVSCSREINQDIFSKIIGGYGLFGIIYEIVLGVVPNMPLKMAYQKLGIDEFYDKYLDAVNDSDVNIKLGRINIINFDEITLIVFKNNLEKLPLNKLNNDNKVHNFFYKKTIDAFENQGVVSKLENNPHEMTKVSQLMYKWLMPIQNGQKFRYFLEKMLKKPLDWNDGGERNGLLYESAATMGTLYNPFIELDRTHILQEYFIPNNGFAEWMEFLKNIFVNSNFNKISLLNITIRYVKEDQTTFLRYAKNDMFAFVFYYRVERHDDANMELEELHNLLTDKVLELDGTFYLPYRHHYSNSQLVRAYPEIKEFIFAKYQIDPDNLFTNMWFEHYRTIFCDKFDQMNRSMTELLDTFDVTVVESLSNSKIIFVDDNEKEKEQELIPTFQNVDNNFNTNRNSYQTIFASNILTYKFKEFLKNIFYLVPPEKLFLLIKTFMKENPDATDIDVFEYVKSYMASFYFPGKILHKYRTIKILSDQRKDFVQQLKNITEKIGVTEINGYVSIGDAGRNIALMKSVLQISGNIYVVNDKQSMVDIIERGQIRSVGKFVLFDYDNDTNFDIADCSTDLVTCLMGLHHFSINNLNQLVKSVHRILRKNGLFIIREHNAYPELVPILNAAHNIFNAVTGETLENEQRENRQFRKINEWIKLIENIGFKNIEFYQMQNNDSTEDFMICFRKIESTSERAKSLLTKYIGDSGEKYVRGLDQTYSTLTEWYLVDVTQKFGKFMEHTPYYSFPYWRNILLYWSLWNRESRIIRQKCGFRKAYLSEYTMASIVMGTTVSIILATMSFLSFIPRMMYTLESNEDAKQVCLMIIHKKNRDFNDNRILILKTEQWNETYLISLIKIPRYLEFTNIVISLAQQDIEFHEICGQKEIQLKIAVDKHKTYITNLVKNMIGCEFLFDYRILENSSINELALSVKIENLSQVINTLLNNRIEILHIYDY